MEPDYLRHYPEGMPAEVGPATETIDRLIERVAREYPSNIAVEFLGRTITYGEIEHHVRKAAGALYRAGVRKGDSVAVLLPNCPQHIVAFYAILSLGAVVAEHNPLAPAAELHEQIDRHGAKVVIAWEQTVEKLATDGDFRGRTYLAVNLSRELPLTSRMLLNLPIESARKQRDKLRGNVPWGVLSFDRVVKKAPSLARGIVAERPELDDLAVLIHTGGTTGVPKAVELTHRNLASNLLQTRAWVSNFRQGREVFLAVLPFFHAFGLATNVILGTACAATLVLMPKFDVPAFIAAHKRHPITVLPGVAPMYQRILETVESWHEPVDLSSIGFAFSGAMALSPELAERWEAATGGYIIEGYGMTEASPIVAGSPVSPARRPSTLGIPFPSTEVRIADPSDLSRDAEGIGEILVRGPQVFRGYHNMPEETQKVLLADGWLRTGDLGHWDDGFIVMADRSKEMIINGGFNVYPSQVENAIKGMPGVRDVAVVGMPADDHGESVVAALVLEPGAIVDLDAVRRWTQDKLSHYAMPKSIAVLDDLPRSQIGKVMRREVRDSLRGAELRGGQWFKAGGETLESFIERAGEYLNGSREQVSEWIAARGETLEGVRAALSRGDEERRAWLSERNLTIDGLKAWIASRDASKHHHAEATEVSEGTDVTKGTDDAGNSDAGTSRERPGE